MVVHDTGLSYAMQTAAPAGAPELCGQASGRQRLRFTDVLHSGTTSWTCWEHCWGSGEQFKRAEALIDTWTPKILTRLTPGPRR